MNKPHITQERVHELLRYYPTSGRFVWRRRPRSWFDADRIWRTWNTRYANTEAGYIHEDGYRKINIKPDLYRAHRLAWFYVHGTWPVEIDHIDHDRLNNRLRNLREVESIDNSRNKRLSPRNRSGVMGVWWYERYQKWHVSIVVKKKRIHLGYLEDFDDAARVKRQAEKEHGFHRNHGR